MYALGQVLHILAGDSSHRNATIVGQVDAVLLDNLLDLLWLHARETEHANLVDDVIPVLLGAQLYEVILQQAANIDDAIGHRLHILQPLGAQVLAVQDLGRNPSPMNGGIGVQATDYDLQLGNDAASLLFVGAHGGEGASTLAIQTHILGETLRQAEVMAIGLEGTYGLGIAVDVASGETLVGHVDEGIQVALLHQRRDLAPLLQSGIHAGRIVGAGVQEDDALLRDFLKDL